MYVEGGAHVSRPSKFRDLYEYLYFVNILAACQGAILTSNMPEGCDVGNRGLGS